jgi:hypothetical protein
VSDERSSEKPAGWVEHTVVANLPRRFPGTALAHAPLAEASEPRTLIGMPRATPPELGVPFAQTDEPRTVVGEAPSPAVAQRLIARYAALAAAKPSPAASEASVPPPAEPWFRRVATFARDDFRRAPRIVRLLLPALPLVAAATTFLDVDPRRPSLSRSVAVAATTSPATPPTIASATLPPALPTSTVPIVRHPGRTLAADAADAAARGDRAQAIALYLTLAHDHPADVVYASAARILMRDEERNRPHSGQ